MTTMARSRESQRRRNVGRVAVWLGLVGLTFFVMTRFASPAELARALARAHPGWLVAAVLVHAAYFVVYAAMYQVGFRAVGVESRMSELLPVYFASTLANALAPAGGAAAAALFVEDAAERGQSPARAAVGTLLVFVAELSTLLPFLAGSLSYLASAHRLDAWELAAAGMFTAFVALILGASLWARGHVGHLERLLGIVARVAHAVAARFHHGDWSSSAWAERIARQLADAATTARSRRHEMGELAGLGIVLHALNQLCLGTLFLAFAQPVSLGAVVAGRTMAVVVFVVGVVPQGLAVVEGAMAYVLTSLGLPGGKVAAAVLAFRGLSYWLPLVLGVVFLRRLRLLRRALGRT